MREVIQQKALSAIIRKGFHGYIDVAPRVGKSKIIIDALKQVPKDKRILITVPFNPILDSWQAEFQKWNLEDPPKVINQRSLSKEKDNSYELIVCDEVHSLSKSQINHVKRVSNGRVLGCSGSISKKTKKNLALELGLTPIYSYSIEQAISSGIISNYQVNVVMCNLDNKAKTIEAGTKKNKFKTTELANYLYLTSQFEKFRKMSWKNPKLNTVKMKWAGARADLLYTCPTKIDVAKRLIELYDRCLVFTARKHIADVLTDCVHYSGKSDGLLKFINGEENKLSVIETVQMGITIPDLKVGIFHQMKSSTEAAIQKVLRMCNLEDDRTAEIFIITAMATVDEDWTRKALSPFEESKIDFIHHTKF